MYKNIRVEYQRELPRFVGDKPFTQIKHGGSVDCSSDETSSKQWQWKECPHERTATSGRTEEYNSSSSVGEYARSSLHRGQFCPNGSVIESSSSSSKPANGILMINNGTKIGSQVSQY